MKERRKSQFNDSDLLLILLGATPDHPVDKKLLAKYARKTLDDQTNDIRLFAWLSFADIYSKGIEEFDKTCVKLTKDYSHFKKIFKVENWDKKRLTMHTKDRNLGLDDNNLMSLIHSDISRMARQIFFLNPLPLNVSAKEEEDAEAGADDTHELMLICREQHMRRIERILYIFAMLNKQMSYIQGFNELIIPFYFVSTKSIDILKGDYDLAETLSFNLFVWLMTNKNFADIYEIENTSTLLAYLTSFEELIKKHIPGAYDVISTLNIHPYAYSLRWFSLLFAQEHELPFLLGIWDTILSRYDVLSTYSMYVALGHIKAVERNLDKTNASKTLYALQNMKIDVGPSVIDFAYQFYYTDFEQED